MVRGVRADIESSQSRSDCAGVSNELDTVGDRYLNAIVKKKHTVSKVELFIDHQNFGDIRRKYLRGRKLFVDSEFRPSKKLLMKKDHKRDIVWLRPKDISPTGEPVFFAGGIEEMDMLQGKAGDCWIVSACSTLIQYPGLFYRVVPPDQTFKEDRYVGMFHFRLWHQTCWYDIIIDDLLPFDVKTNKLRYARSSNPNEFWGALLEKAFAKVYGSYEAIGKGGLVSRTLTSITGGVCYTYYLNLESTTFENMTEMFEAMLPNGHLACARSKHRDKERKAKDGLGSGHGYSIKGCCWVRYGGDDVFLVSLRNPWGKKEWTGRWSDDDSDRWNAITAKQRRRLHSGKEDGVFWMEWDDFTLHFNQVTMCHLSYDIFYDIYLVTKKLAKYERRWFKIEFPLEYDHVIDGLDIHLGKSSLEDSDSDDSDSDTDDDDLPTSVMVVTVHRLFPLEDIKSGSTKENMLPAVVLSQVKFSSSRKRFVKSDTYNKSDIGITKRYIVKQGCYSLTFDDEYAESYDYHVCILVEVPTVIAIEYVPYLIHNWNHEKIHC